MSEQNDDVVLDVKGLQTYFYTDDGVVKAVDGLSYQVRKGEFVGLVGESGCGKSVSAMSVLRLIPYPPGVIAGGQIVFKGEDLLQASEERMREIRGNRIAMVFQEPTTSLNPVLTVGRQISESLELHRGLDKNEARDESARLLDLVGIPDPSKRVTDYPYQFSGGMQQRIMIAMALSCDPELLRADHLVGRHGTGAAAGDHRQATGRVSDGSRRHHPQPRVGGALRRSRQRDVRWQAGGVGPDRDHLRRAQAPLHSGSAGFGSALGQPPQGGAEGDPRAAAEPRPPAAGLLVCTPLRVCDGRVPRVRSSAGAGRDDGSCRGSFRSRTRLFLRRGKTRKSGHVGLTHE